MSVSLYDLSVGSYVQIVDASIGFLAKGAEHAEAQGQSQDDLTQLRLIDDMANFIFQVECIGHHSLGAIRGAQAGEFAPPPGLGEVSYADLQAYLDNTAAELKALTEDEVNGLAGGRLVFKLGGNEIPFSVENFLLSFSLPNFYFHATTAYDLLRANGVQLGKMNFLGQLKMG